MTELLKNGFSAMKLSVSDAQIAQLEDFTARMLETNKVMNLTRITDPKEIAEKHRLCIPAAGSGFFKKIRGRCRLRRGLSGHAAAYFVPVLQVNAARFAWKTHSFFAGMH